MCGAGAGYGERASSELIGAMVTGSGGVGCPGGPSSSQGLVPTDGRVAQVCDQFASVEWSPGKLLAGLVVRRLDRRSAVELDPYSLIAEFWGEELSPELASRMVDAPEDHLDSFQDFLFDRPSSGMGRPPELLPGHLRPVLMSNVEDQVWNRASAIDIVGLAPGLLLYAHEIVLDDVVFNLVSDDRQERQRTVQWLLQVRPLHQQRCLLFRPLASSKRHPAYRAAFRDEADKLVLIAGEVSAHVDKLSGRLAEQRGIDEAQARLIVIDGLIQDATIHIRHGASWGDRTHRLFRSKIEIDVLTAYLNYPAPFDARDANLMTLANLVVPSFTHNVPTLVSVRHQSDAFAEWRSQLARALDRLTLVEAHDESSVKIARQRLHEELLPLTEGLAKETRRSASLSALTNGVKSFGVALVSGLAGYTVGGSITTAATSAAAAKALETVQSYRKNRKEQRQRAELAELAIALIAPQPT